jgi:pyruvate/2-oxoglutarate/acetoin dehydrogenase E1 component
MGWMQKVGEYFDELCKAMALVAEHPRSIFIGQAVECPGTAMSNTFRDVPREKLLELPVFEDCQMGMATGLSIAGELPICIYPRINFLLLAINQLVLHLDKLPVYGNGYKPKVLIRTAIASDKPMDPGPQHLGDYTMGIQSMLSTVDVIKLDHAYKIIPAYKQALSYDRSTLLIEYLGKYDE